MPADTPALMRLTTVLGEGGLLFKSMSATEELGQPFEFQVQALSGNDAVVADDLLGTPASVALQLGDGSVRHFHALVCGFSFDGLHERLFSYRLVLRPWLWLLTRRADTRIFQNKTVKQILEAVFEPFSADVKFQLSGSYEPIDYCVQYRETDFNFVSRLMEQEGLYYHFEHEQNKHTLVIVDSGTAHQNCPVQNEYLYRESVDALLDFEPITEWRVDHEIQPGQVVLRYRNFELPGAQDLITAKSVRPKALPKLEHYDGGHSGKRFADLLQPAEAGKLKPEGERYAKLRIEELQARYLRVTGSGSVRALRTGTLFKLSEFPRADQNGKNHLVLSTRIDMGYSGYESEGGESFFRCRFSAMPASETFRLPRSTPKPTVAGLHTAVVVGPSGQEIYTDANGRIKVQFHWDRLGQNNQDSSCWLRVSHAVAGKGWGMIALPRIGQEVIVEFLEGDPDHPIVTGSVYNNDQVTPYKLPDHATVATLKSRSSLNGAATDFNELRFEDKKDSEYIWFQAQKDFYQYVKHDHITLVDNDLFRIVKKNVTEEVKENVQRLIGKDLKEQVKGKAGLTVDGDRAIEVKGKQDTKATGDLVFESGAVVSVKSGADTHIKIGANLGVDAAANVHIKGGANVVIEAGAMLTLKAGGSSIVLGPTLSITGSMVLINSGGGPGAGSGASPKTPAAPDLPEAPEPPVDPLA
jgi:type VI secretion system secreted protein VgrG